MPPRAKASISKLETFQKRVLKWVLNDYASSYLTRLSKTKILPLSLSKYRIYSNSPTFIIMNKVTCRLVNNLPYCVDFFNTVGLKYRLLEFFSEFCSRYYNDNNSCTWQYACDCRKCRNSLIHWKL